MVEMIVLRVVHVLGGVFWVGSAVFNGIYLFPALAEAGPAAGSIMGSMQKRRLFIVLPVVAVLTILSGLRLMWITSGGFASAYFTTGRGATFAAAGGAAILAFVLGMAIGRPTAIRMGTIRQTLATTQDAEARARLMAELGVLERRSTWFGWVMMALLIFAAAGMAAGRYIV